VGNSICMYCTVVKMKDRFTEPDNSLNATQLFPSHSGLPTMSVELMNGEVHCSIVSIRENGVSRITFDSVPATPPRRGHFMSTQYFTIDTHCWLARLLRTPFLKLNSFRRSLHG
jgi:hypothetical protein